MAKSKSTRSDYNLLSSEAKPPNAITIVSIKLERILGQYSYDIPSEGGALDRVPILYGENGVGKTTILKILFHLLSSANNRGHRTALSKIRFRSVEVHLSNKIVVSAKRHSAEMTGGFNLAVKKFVGKKEKLLARWDWVPNRETSEESSLRWRITQSDLVEIRKLSKTTGKLKQTLEIRDSFNRKSDPPDGNDAYCAALKEYVPPIFYLSSDRILLSDTVEPRVLRQNRAEIDSSGEMLTRGRLAAIVDAVTDASRALSRIAISATRQGSSSMHSIHLELLKKLATSKQQSKNHNKSDLLLGLVKRLDNISEEYLRFSTHGLAPEIDTSSISNLLTKSNDSNRVVTIKIVENYLDSLDQQSISLKLAYQAIHTLVSTINEFLFDKKVGFILGEGIRIVNGLGETLQPQELSSGEQQLLLLFCHINIAHDTGGIFIVDEPEISLNIKWQRKLIDSLLTLDRASNLQFILASHSIELITKHQESVVVLSE
jgi:energy-coupling factor transporter ATP-binding protein EcfA2